jgi:hypothetical protein
LTIFREIAGRNIRRERNIQNFPIAKLTERNVVNPISLGGGTLIAYAGRRPALS